MDMKWTLLKQATNTEVIMIAIRLSKHGMHQQQQDQPDLSYHVQSLLIMFCLKWINERKLINGLIDGGIEEFVLK